MVLTLISSATNLLCCTAHIHQKTALISAFFAILMYFNQELIIFKWKFTPSMASKTKIWQKSANLKFQEQIFKARIFEGSKEAKKAYHITPQTDMQVVAIIISRRFVNLFKGSFLWPRGITKNLKKIALLPFVALPVQLEIARLFHYYYRLFSGLVLGIHRRNAKS